MRRPPRRRIAAFIGLPARAAALRGLSARSTGGKRADPNANAAPTRTAPGVVPPSNFQPVGTLSGSLGLTTTLTEADFAEALRKQRPAKQRKWTAPDE